MSKVSDQKKIGDFIKNLRKSRGMTQGEFAKVLKTSQSAVARMESGGQNFTTQELARISEVLNRQIIEISDSMDFEINGGKKLSGTICTNTSKNGALALIFASLLNKGTSVIRDVPRIEEINRVVEFLNAIGVSIKWLGDHDLEIKPPKKFILSELINESAKKIRSSLYLIGPLLHFEKNFKLPNAGGCKMGARTIAAHQYGLEEFGVKVETKSDHYEISYTKLKPADVVMYEMSDSATINVLFAAAKIPGETIIRFASANYQVQDTCFFLKKLGVEITGIGTTTLTVKGKSNIDVYIEHHVSEDPTETMMWLAAGIVTKSNLTIKRCPIDFLSLELLKLEKMGLKYEKSSVYKSKNGETNLVDLKIKPSKLIALEDKIHAQPYPGINTDNLPFFATIAGLAEGTTLIHDWMWENRAIYFMELTKLGFDMTLADPHRVYVTGPTNFKPNQIICPPALRPATIILVAMLATPGKSILRNVYSIRRGYEEIADRLNSLGADIKVIKGI
jgi:UDP-N-acetylglucosamine 1-carboxyvinyltransferase